MEKADQAETELRYVQYLPNNIGEAHTNVDSAIKGLYKPEKSILNKTQKSEVVSKRYAKEKPSYSLNLKKEFNMKFNDVSGFLSGRAKEKCIGHKHTRQDWNSKDIDLADIQTNAFKFMIIQKPNKACKAGDFNPDVD